MADLKKYESVSSSTSSSTSFITLILLVLTLDEELTLPPPPPPPLAPIERRDKYNTIQADSLSQYDFILSEEDEREKNTYSHPSLVVLMRMLSTILFLLAFVAMMQYLLVNRIRVLFVPPKSMVDIFLMIILSPGTIFPGCTRPSLFSLPYSPCFAPLDNSNEVHSKVLAVRALTNPTEDAFS